jgi:hypothetical protein
MNEDKVKKYWAYLESEAKYQEDEARKDDRFKAIILIVILIIILGIIIL